MDNLKANINDTSSTRINTLQVWSTQSRAVTSSNLGGNIPCLCSDLPNSDSVLPSIIHCPLSQFTGVKDFHISELWKFFMSKFTFVTIADGENYKIKCGL